MKSITEFLVKKHVNNKLYDDKEVCELSDNIIKVAGIDTFISTNKKDSLDDTINKYAKISNANKLNAFKELVNVLNELHNRDTNAFNKIKKIIISINTDNYIYFALISDKNLQSLTFNKDNTYKSATTGFAINILIGCLSNYIQYINVEDADNSFIGSSENESDFEMFIRSILKTLK